MVLMTGEVHFILRDDGEVHFILCRLRMKLPEESSMMTRGNCLEKEGKKETLLKARVG